jgi:short-subunit dehydrogenase
MRQGKPLNEQVMVITGGSSGIGLATARLAASRGARVVLAARNEGELQAIVDEIFAEGGQAIGVTADVADPAAVDRVGTRAIEAFGRIDTWVNDAGVSIFGKLTEVPLADKRRLFETNFWGVVHGCRTAVRHLRSTGGTIVNIGSVVSDLAVPLQGIYSASKHAVKAYTNALRMELEHDKIPIAITLVKPSGINTPFFDHARNYMVEKPAPPPPVYSADVVAETICRVAERPVRDITVGGGGRAFTAIGSLAPRTMDAYLERTMFRQQKRAELNDGRDTLYEPGDAGRQSGGGYERHVMQSSAYTRAMLSDLGRALPFVALGAVVAAGVTAARRH